MAASQPRQSGRSEKKLATKQTFLSLHIITHIFVVEVCVFITKIAYKIQCIFRSQNTRKICLLAMWIQWRAPPSSRCLLVAVVLVYRCRRARKRAYSRIYIYFILRRYYHKVQFVLILIFKMCCEPSEKERRTKFYSVAMIACRHTVRIHTAWYGYVWKSARRLHCRYKCDMRIPRALPYLLSFTSKRTHSQTGSHRNM